MEDYDRVMLFLRALLKDKLYCEDGALRSTCMKYDIINFMRVEDKKWLDELLKELEYEGEL